MTQHASIQSPPDPLAIGTSMHQLLEEVYTSLGVHGRLIDISFCIERDPDPFGPEWVNKVDEVMAAYDRDMLAPRTWLA